MRPEAEAESVHRLRDKVMHALRLYIPHVRSIDKRKRLEDQIAPAPVVVGDRQRDIRKFIECVSRRQVNQRHTLAVV